MIAIHARSARKETAIQHLVNLKTEVLNFLNGEPKLSYSEFYTMYSEARAYLLESEASDAGMSQSMARLPALIKPSLFFIDVRQIKNGCSTGVLHAYLFTSVLFVAAPITLPLMILQTYRERKIMVQLNKLYNTLERILWKLVTE